MQREDEMRDHVVRDRERQRHADCLAFLGSCVNGPSLE